MRWTIFRRDASHPDPRGDLALDGKFDVVASVYALCYATTPDELADFFTTPGVRCPRRAVDWWP
jgi:hypothetical protein